MKFLCILVLLFSSSIYAFVDNVNKIPKKDQKHLSQVDLSASSKIILEQYLEQKEKYNKKDSYELKLICDKESEKKAAKCKLVQYKVLSPPGPR